jgi:NADP-dependent 3-hydroxy acid dehydrogenase YdfG
MPKTIAVIGAGPGIGLAIAEHFGREGFNVALLARNAGSLDGLTNKLKAQGVNAAAFPADVMDRPGLVAALQKAIAHFGTIDVLEYGPTPPGDSLRQPTGITIENEQFHLDFSVLGAIAAVHAVLPGMLERKDGGLLFTTAASAQYPVTFTASFGVAAGAALNYARVLNQELAPQGIYAGIVSVAGLVVQEGQTDTLAGHGLPPVTAKEVAQVHWDLYTRRDKAEAFAGDIQALLKMLGH